MDVYFLPVLEAGSPKSGWQHGWVLGRMLSLACRWLPTFSCSHWEERALAGISSYEDTNPMGQDPTLRTSYNLNYIHKGWISKQSCWGLGFDICVCGEGSNIKSINTNWSPSSVSSSLKVGHTGVMQHEATSSEMAESKFNQTFKFNFLPRKSENIARMDQKGPDRKDFPLCRPYGPCHSYSTLLLHGKSSHGHYVNKRAELRSNKALFMDTDIWVT